MDDLLRLLDKMNEAAWEWVRAERIYMAHPRKTEFTARRLHEKANERLDEYAEARVALRRALLETGATK